MNDYNNLVWTIRKNIAPFERKNYKITSWIPVIHVHYSLLKATNYNTVLCKYLDLKL